MAGVAALQQLEDAECSIRCTNWAIWSVAPLRFAAMMQSSMLRSPLNPAADTEIARTAAAASDLFESMTRRYRKPAWDLPHTTVNGARFAVTPKSGVVEPVVQDAPFRARRGRAEAARGERIEPAVLIVAPMSGHYATLLRGTVEAFLPDHEVYITDWANARNVPVLEGRFDFHDYIDHVCDMLRALGPAGARRGGVSAGPAGAGGGVADGARTTIPARRRR